MGDIEEDEGSHNRGDNNDDDKQMNASAPTWTLAICGNPSGRSTSSSDNSVSTSSTSGHGSNSRSRSGNSGSGRCDTKNKQGPA